MSPIKLSYMILIAVQMVHFWEEFKYDFMGICPWTRKLNQKNPTLSKTLFLSFTFILLILGIIGYIVWIGPEKNGWEVIIWLWVIGEIINSVAHSMWSLRIRKYNPGLITAIVLFPIEIFLLLKLL